MIELLTNPYVLGVIKAIVVFAGVMTMVPMLIWLERKVVADVQIRLGPNRVGPLGVMQPLADAVKLMFKEAFVPGGANKIIFLAAPVMIFVPALIAWAVMPYGPNPFTGAQMILAVCRPIP